jgi:acetyl-CoA carboxylase biotin carboxyl carrier protein
VRLADYVLILPTAQEKVLTTENVKADITGTVWKIVAQVGQALDEEEPILIMESMKMEIPVTAPLKGRLKQLLVAEAEEVSEGQIVAIIET